MAGVCAVSALSPSAHRADQGSLVVAALAGVSEKLAARKKCRIRALERARSFLLLLVGNLVSAIVELLRGRDYFTRVSPDGVVYVAGAAILPLLS